MGSSYVLSTGIFILLSKFLHYINMNVVIFHHDKWLCLKQTGNMTNTAHIYQGCQYFSGLPVLHFHEYLMQHSLKSVGTKDHLRCLRDRLKMWQFFSNEVSFIWLRPPTHPLQMKVWKTEFNFMPFFKCIFKDLLTNLNVQFCFFSERKPPTYQTKLTSFEKKCHIFETIPNSCTFIDFVV